MAVSWSLDIKTRLVPLGKSYKDLHERLLSYGLNCSYWTVSAILANFKLPTHQMKEQISRAVQEFENEAGISTIIEERR